MNELQTISERESRARGRGRDRMSGRLTMTLESHAEPKSGVRTDFEPPGTPILFLIEPHIDLPIVMDSGTWNNMNMRIYSYLYIFYI